ncbi:alpha/beta hydrolase [Roseateles sp. DJS-2-20]|uniref:Alpha/beta hydrolase n=2 Tax=Roseateles paludis TaxID=3145238 RepID=A0ABV0FZ48_9BURK
MTSRYLVCLGREIHLTEWAAPGLAPDAPVLVAWHGLARSGRDFDVLARQLCDRWRVICPDTVGRGLSQWAEDPAAEYHLGAYVALAESLLDQLGLTQCDWLGTSMGGAIGLLGAATRLQGRIRRLVLNDIGPEIEAAAVARIRTYAGAPPAFATVTELEAYFREIYASFGVLTDAQWRQLTETSLRRLPDGRVTPHYDPRIVQQFERATDDYLLWDAWDRLRLPVLCLRGADSSLLSATTAEAMRTRGPLAELITVPGCGHAPALNTAEQIGWVERFLSASEIGLLGGVQR